MPQLNGVAEILNKALLEKAQCMISNVVLPKKFWTKVFNAVCYFVNMYLSTTIDCKTPDGIWSGYTTIYSILHVFGCPAYTHVNEGKLEVRELINTYF